MYRWIEKVIWRQIEEKRREGMRRWEGIMTYHHSLPRTYTQYDVVCGRIHEYVRSFMWRISVPSGGKKSPKPWKCGINPDEMRVAAWTRLQYVPIPVPSDLEIFWKYIWEIHIRHLWSPHSPPLLTVCQWTSFSSSPLLQSSSIQRAQPLHVHRSRVMY